MKMKFISIILSAMALIACTNSSNSSTDNSKNPDSTKGDISKTVPKTDTIKSKVSVKEIVDRYLDIKNALANDDDKDAAKAANQFIQALSKTDKPSMTSEQRKRYEDIEADSKEMAEHISKSAGKIAHQREHFEMLSKDMYDLTKIFGGGQQLYKDYCPMYNDGKGASWLSESKDIKNPYMGKDMTSCGELKEEIK